MAGKTLADYQREEAEATAAAQKRRDEEAKATALQTASGIFGSIWNNLGTIIIVGILALVLFGTDMGKKLLEGAKDMLGGFAKMLPDSWQEKLAELTGMDVSQNLKDMPLEDVRKKMAEKQIPEKVISIVTESKEVWQDFVGILTKANGGKLALSDLKDFGGMMKKIAASDQLDVLLDANHIARTMKLLTAYLGQDAKTLMTLISGGLDARTGKPTQALRDSITAMIDGNAAGAAPLMAAALSSGKLSGSQMILALDAQALSTGADGKEDPTMKKLILGMQRAVQVNPIAKGAIDTAIASLSPAGAQQFIAGLTTGDQGTALRALLQPDTVKSLPYFINFASSVPELKAVVEQSIPIATLRQFTTPQKLQALGNIAKNGVDVLGLMPGFVGIVDQKTGKLGPSLDMAVDSMLNQYAKDGITTGKLRQAGPDNLAALIGDPRISGQTIGAMINFGQEVSAKVPGNGGINTSGTLAVVHAIVNMAKGDVSPKEAFTYMGADNKKHPIDAKMLSGFFSRPGNHNALLTLLKSLDVKVLPVAQQHLVTALIANMGDFKTHGLTNLLADERGAQLFLENLSNAKPGSTACKSTPGLGWGQTIGLTASGIDWNAPLTLLGFATGPAGAALALGGTQTNVIGRNSDVIKSLAKAFDVAQCETVAAPAHTPQKPAAAAAKH